MPQPKLFISYARDDDERFAEKLYQDLTHAYSLDIWWDREKMRSRGRTFLQEIRDAIFRCDFLILVLGPKAKESEYVQDEWEHALHYYKTVIPVLRVGLGHNDDTEDFGQIPDRLRQLHCYDFRDDASYQDTLSKLARDMLRGELQLGPLLGVPALPPHYIPRPNDMNAVSRYVLADINSPIVITSEKQTVTLQGMGGVGKSVIATAFARAGETRRAFPDGIVWITVGQDAELRALYQQVGVLLDDSPQMYTDEATAKASLQKMLADRACLLVLDDTWQVRDAAPFKDIVAETRCRLLVTTRNMDICRELGAQEHQVKLLSPEQAEELLRGWAGRDDPDLAAVAERLDYLALALKIAGGRISRGLSGAEWLAKYDRVSQIRTTRRATDRGESLEISIELGVDAVLEDDEKLLYYTLGIYKEETRIPQTVVVRLWQHIDSTLEETTSTEIINELVDIALIERHEDQTIALHDLLHDYAREKLGDRYGQTHLDLLAAYNPDGRPWPQIPHDGYLYFHLAHHLREAGHQDELYALLTSSPKWMEAKFITCVGDTAYAADLDLALADFEDPLHTDQLLTLTQLHTARHLVLARVSIYTNFDLNILVWLNRVEEALSHARLRTTPYDRSTGLLSIYHELAKKSENTLGLLNEILETVGKVQNPREKIKVFHTLVFPLIEAHGPREARKFVDEISHMEDRSIAQKTLSRALGRTGHYSEAQEVAGEIQNAERRASSLRYVVESLCKDGYFDLAKTTAMKIDLEHEQRRALYQVAESLALAGESVKAQELVVQVDPDEDSPETLGALARILAAESHFVKAKQLASAIIDEDVQAYTLQFVSIIQARRGEYAESQETMSTIRHSSFQKRALRALVESLIQAKEFQKAREIVSAISDSREQERALRNLGIALAENNKQAEADEVFQELSHRIRFLRDYDAQLSALRSLAMALAQASRLQEAEIILSEIKDLILSATKKTERLQDLYSNLLLTIQIEPSNQGIQHNSKRELQKDRTNLATVTSLVEKKKWIETIPNKRKHVLALCDLAREFDEIGKNQKADEIYDQAIMVTADIRPLGTRIGTLVSLAKALTETRRFEQVWALEEHFQSIGSLAEGAWPSVLRTLASALNRLGQTTEATRAFGEALMLAKKIGDTKKRARAYKSLVISLFECGRENEAREVLAEMEGHAKRIQTLVDLAELLSNSDRYQEANALYAEALQVAKSGKNASAETRLLQGLAISLVQSGRFNEASEVAEDIRSATAKEAALFEIARCYAQSGRFKDASQMVLRIRSTARREKILRTLTGSLSQAGYFDDALENAKKLQNIGDEEALTNLVSAMAHAGHFSQAHVAVESIKSVQSRAKAYCDLATILANTGKNVEAEKAYSSAYACSDAITDDTARLNALRYVAVSLVRTKHFSEAQKIADVIQSAGNKAGHVHEIVEALVEHKRFAQAFTLLDFNQLDSFLEILVKWCPAFDQTKDGLSRNILREVIRIAAWLYPEWNDLYKLMTNATDRD